MNIEAYTITFESIAIKSGNLVNCSNYVTVFNVNDVEISWHMDITRRVLGNLPSHI